MSQHPDGGERAHLNGEPRLGADELLSVGWFVMDEDRRRR